MPGALQVYSASAPSPGAQWAAVSRDELDVAQTLRSGQCFRWRKTPAGEWRGSVGGRILRLWPAEGGFWWETAPAPPDWGIVRRYFALDVDLAALQRAWIRAEPRVADAVARWPGLRVLRQEAVEVLFAFLCASCNTMTKIGRSVNALAARYGPIVGVVEGEPVHGFPEPELLMRAAEADLRADLWGFRAPRVAAAARHVVARGPGWLESLRTAALGEARSELMSLFGVGPKIADCVCLFGLWHDSAAPIDTHVRRAAARLGGPELATAGYEACAASLRERFGEKAGWAQQYLFVDEAARSRRRALAAPHDTVG